MFVQSLKIQELQQQALTLHRDVASMMALLGHRPEAAEQFMLGNGVPLFPAKMGSRGYLGDTAMLGIEPGLNKFTPHSEVEVLTWDFISRSLYSASSTNPRRRIDSPLKEGLEDVVREVMDMINMYSKQRGRVIEYREILYGYHRLNPQYGADYILDLLLVYKKYRGRKMTVPVRRHVYLQQQFTVTVLVLGIGGGDLVSGRNSCRDGDDCDSNSGTGNDSDNGKGLEIRETIDGEEVVIKSREEDEEDSVLEDQLESHQVQSPFRDAFENGLLKIGEVFPGMLSPSEPKDSASKIRNKIINFILPLSGRFEIFQRFLSVYEDVCLQDDQKTTLTVVLYPSFTDPPSFNNSLSLLQRFQLKYPLSRIDVISASGSFARAEALELGASRFDDKVDNLLFFVDVDMVFNTKTLERIRLNTIKGKQAYFPIVFSEFDPSFSIHRTGALRNHFVVNRDTGYWRQFGFGIVSVYRSDMKLIGGYDTGIRGWGKEDVDLFDKFVTVAANFTVFRSADPQLVHVFHIVDCDPKLDDVQLSMCKGSRADTYGSVTQLAQYIYNRKDQIFQFAKYRKHQEPPS
ncbi:hypothetical protein ANN_03128 [Periplaneta americana]|uniref:Hexosyltransferase n=1 Tax=Periplaneta americana TaxID=6978 RepID=A0ABQ8TZD4_PERAM|nr:hypothetical protein ANN_03128 [Periplaneta americana]